MNVVIIGGGSAGTTCAFELRKLNKDINITILESTSFYEYSPCALPYVISKDISSFEDIFIYGRKDYESNNIDLKLNSTVKSVEFDDKKISYIKDEEMKQLDYDKLVVATGASPFIPKVEGLDDFLTLKTASDISKLEDEISREEKFLIVGGGMVGVEVAEALNKRGNEVTIIESSSHILSAMLDKDMSKILKDKLAKEGITVIENERLSKYDKSLGKVVFCTGVVPNDFLKLEKDRGYLVNKSLETNIKDVYACGDVSYSSNMVTGDKMLSGLGTTAVRQGMVAARNILDMNDSFDSVLNNTISKISDLYVGSVGINSAVCNDKEINFTSGKVKSPVRAHYYSTEENIVVKLLVDFDYKILGAQIIGDAEVVGRLNMISLAITKGITIKELARLETCYNPASAPIFDPVTQVCNICVKKVDVLLKRGV